MQPDVRLTILRNILTDRGPGWTKYRHLRPLIATAIGSYNGWDRRVVADLAEEASGEILSCGKGYMLARFATEKEILEAYGCIVRKAIGTDRRARTIIAFARRHNLLHDPDAPERVRRDIAKEFEAATGRPPTTPAAPAKPKAVTIEQMPLL